jgi:hypothetical protein
MSHNLADKCFHVGIYSTVFLKKKSPGTQSDPKFGRRGVVLVIPMPGKKKVLECPSGLYPSEKELLEWCSITEIPLGI